MEEKINGSDNTEMENTPQVPDEVNETAKEENTGPLYSDGPKDAEAQSEPSETCKAEPETGEEKPKIRENAATYAYRWDYTSQVEYNESQKKKSSSRGAVTYAIIISSVFAVAFLMLALFIIFGNGVGTTINYSGTASFESVVAEEMMPSIILISTGSNYGSGFVISEDGYAVTNHHVVEPAMDKGEVQVTFEDGREYTAKIIGSSESDDIAVIKIDGHGFRAAPIGSSSKLVVGDEIVAMGNPGGIKYPFTVTSGIVSALNRDLKLVDDSNIYQRTVKAIQFTAPVNSGNSGGPIVNNRGEVVGIIFLKSSSSYDGIGFALPIDESMVIVNEIIRNGNADGIDSPLSSDRPMLGITAVGVQSDYYYVITDTGIEVVEESELENYPDAFKANHTGVLVTGISTGMGAEGKLEVGDIILKINGVSVTSVAKISYALLDAKAGDTATVDFSRGDEILNVKIVLS